MEGTWLWLYLAAAMRTLDKDKSIWEVWMI